MGLIVACFEMLFFWLFRKIMERPIVAKGGAKVHFVDDRLDTLKAIKASPGMADVKLYFASWYSQRLFTSIIKLMGGIRGSNQRGCGSWYG